MSQTPRFPAEVSLEILKYTLKSYDDSVIYNNAMVKSLLRARIDKILIKSDLQFQGAVLEAFYSVNKFSIRPDAYQNQKLVQPPQHVRRFIRYLEVRLPLFGSWTQMREGAYSLESREYADIGELLRRGNGWIELRNLTDRDRMGYYRLETLKIKWMATRYWYGPNTTERARFIELVKNANIVLTASKELEIHCEGPWEDLQQAIIFNGPNPKLTSGRNEPSN
ncbi:hypothetical protein B0J11DRAFT_576702 [Dendryphion nanum]|uniref:Uncharacterized protein n=1 Tax=Dendryphion nanum TaxID=256645 RepID=A0A9P9IUP7_9PLEO|nr:hypothetical protein B0J11DRAFT_576702 [Dendryphion nanum]